jgi:phenylacetic acid degradation operon negative regulatory protein
VNETSVPRIAPRAVVEQCLDALGGEVGLGDVFDVAGVLGVEEQPVRLALRRLVVAGAVVQSGRGRAALLTWTGAAGRRAALDAEYWRFAADLDRGVEQWDGVWSLLAFSVPESRRADRDALRAVLTRLGAAALTPGLYLSPYDLGPALTAELPGRDPALDLTVARASQVHHGGLPVEERIPELWPLDDLRAEYAVLDRAVDRWAEHAAEGEPVLRLAARIAVGAAVETAVGPDPLLPPTLLPADWPGAWVRARVRALWPA